MNGIRHREKCRETTKTNLTDHLRPSLRYYFYGKTAIADGMVNSFGSRGGKKIKRMNLPGAYQQNKKKNCPRLFLGNFLFAFFRRKKRDFGLAESGKSSRWLAMRDRRLRFDIITLMAAAFEWHNSSQYCALAVVRKRWRPGSDSTLAVRRWTWDIRWHRMR